MSRIGKKTIEIPAGVTINVNNNVITVKGPKGELTYEHRPEVKVNVAGNEANVEVVLETKKSSAYWGLTRALIANMVAGVTEEFTKKLELVGVGYRVASEGPKKLSLTVGYSNPVIVEAPEGISFEVPDNKNISISGIDKQLVGLTAAKIRKIRKPEPYKGKGIKYDDEHIRRKPGKAGKA